MARASSCSLITKGGQSCIHSPLPLCSLFVAYMLCWHCSCAGKASPADSRIGHKPLVFILKTSNGYLFHWALELVITGEGMSDISVCMNCWATPRR